jgi:hypothetical protein
MLHARGDLAVSGFQHLFGHLRVFREKEKTSLQAVKQRVHLPAAAILQEKGTGNVTNR